MDPKMMWTIGTAFGGALVGAVAAIGGYFKIRGSSGAGRAMYMSDETKKAVEKLDRTKIDTDMCAVNQKNFQLQLNHLNEQVHELRKEDLPKLEAKIEDLIFHVKNGKHK